MMNFEELDNITRDWMLKEFQNEETSGKPYRSKNMTSGGKSAFSKTMENAIRNGNEVTLARELANPTFWESSYTAVRNGKPYRVSINPIDAARKLALTEFNTWYVRGLARRLTEEGVEYCEVYRAEAAWQPRPECEDHDGKRFKVSEIYNGHRARYWPTENPAALSVPVGVNCHHTIRRST
ncbi:MAG TPA: hypothetical protein VJP79_03170 [Nitrososphaera sp.]|nr:hypothetical protein [Nitrososphaera sp.]